MEYFEAAIANSDDQDKSRLYAARSLWGANPGREDQIPSDNCPQQGRVTQTQTHPKSAKVQKADRTGCPGLSCPLSLNDFYAGNRCQHYEALELNHPTR